MATKATFDVYTRVITLTEAPIIEDGEYIVRINVAADLYGDGKEDWKASELFRRLIYPIRAVGGDAIPSGRLDGTYFLRSDWKIRPYDADQRLLVDGNFFSEDGKSPFLTVPGRTVIIEQALSAIVGATYADEQAIIIAADLAADPYVYFDVNGVPGTTDDVGTRGNPVNNVADTFALLTSRNKLSIKIFEGTFTLDRTVDNVNFEGCADPHTSSVDLNGFATTRCSFSHLTLQGSASTSSLNVTMCHVSNLSGCRGEFFQSYIHNIALDSSSGRVIFDTCRAHDNGPLSTIINANGRSGNIEVRSWSGDIGFTNLTHASTKVSVEMESGYLTLDASNTSVASFKLRGVGRVTNDSALTLDDEGFTGTFLPRILSLARALLGLS